MSFTYAETSEIFLATVVSAFAAIVIKIFLWRILLPCLSNNSFSTQPSFKNDLSRPGSAFRLVPNPLLQRRTDIVLYSTFSGVYVCRYQACRSVPVFAKQHFPVAFDIEPNARTLPWHQPTTGLRSTGIALGISAALANVGTDVVARIAMLITISPIALLAFGQQTRWNRTLALSLQQADDCHLWRSLAPLQHLRTQRR